jgi:hypothetical protein
MTILQHEERRAAIAAEAALHDGRRVEDRGLAPVQRNCAWGTLTSGAPKEPKAFWHMRQWQKPAGPSGPSMR